MKLRRSLAPALAVVALTAALVGCNWRGPDPTEATVTATTGSFAIATSTVAAGNGFGGGTIYAPTDTSQGTFGAVVVTPGFLMDQSTMSWYGPRLATQGFVVLTINTNSTTDNPAQRGTEMLAALDWLTTASPVASQIDPARLAALGWSMGGGGALRAGVTRPSLKAVIGAAPWNDQPDFSTLTVPTLIVACQNDSIAPVARHASPIYNSIPRTVPSEYIEIAGEDHFCVTTNNTNAAERTAIARQVISFLKRYVDSDTRYDTFLCPAPSVGGVISDSRSTCAS